MADDRKSAPRPGASAPVLDAVDQRSLPPGSIAAGQATYLALDDAPCETGDKRAELRQRKRLRTGKIADRDGRFIVECVFHDRSARGARVRLGRNIPVPAVLRLYDDERRTFAAAQLAWRRGQEIGIAFVPDIAEAAAVVAGALMGEQFYAVRD